MTIMKRIICLSNSRKLNARCIAGKEIDNDEFGSWIRPVSEFGSGELPVAMIRCEDGHIPELLDILDIPLLRHTPHSFQTENYVIERDRKWSYKGKLDISKVTELCNQVNEIWINGYSSSCWLHDRIPSNIAERKLNSSLLLVYPETLIFSVGYEFRSRKVRAVFNYKDEEYRITVTDPIVEHTLLQEKDGFYEMDSIEVYLCISLGEPFESHAYKLVAGVINFLENWKR